MTNPRAERESRQEFMGRQIWQPEEIEILRRTFATNPTQKIADVLKRTHSTVSQKAANLGLKKSAEYLESPAAGRLTGKDNRGGATRFQKGQTPPNKGLRRPGWAPGRMAATQFKAGEMRGAAQHNYVPIGSTRISKDGYLERKINDTHPVPARRWVGEHRLVWEAANGPVPEGHVVVFLPGRQSQKAEEITVASVELVTRAELMSRNTLWNRYPLEVAQVMQLRGALNRKIKNRSKSA